MSSASDSTIYDEILYPSYTHKSSHPGVLATQATLHGLRPAPVGNCRVLELGCGNGSNLIPMAYGLPGSRFIGADLSIRAVENGNGAIRDLGLTNIELRHANILDIDSSWGEFDYIIAHGVFSWVPPVVRDKVLTICQDLLAPQGVAFISFLALPGAHVRAMLREMMLFHAGGTKEAAVLLSAAKEMASFIAGAPAGDPVQQALHGEATRFLEATPNYLLHDDLGEWNEAFYFVQFAGMAAEHGLQFLAEAEPIEMVDLHLPPPVRENLARIARGRLHREQYLDFLKGRRFRQTLLCRTGLTVSESAVRARVSELWVSCPSKGPDGAIDLSPGVEAAFSSPRGPSLDTAMPAGKAALVTLIKAWPLRLQFSDLVQGVREKLAAAGVSDAAVDGTAAGLAGFLLHLNSAGLVDLHCEPLVLCKVASDRPVASAVSRWQAIHGNLVTTLRHVSITLQSEITLRLIPLLDGTRTHGEIVDAMLGITNAPGVDPAAERAEMAAAVAQRLERFASEGILMA